MEKLFLLSVVIMGILFFINLGQIKLMKKQIESQRIILEEQGKVLRGKYGPTETTEE